ncbi:MAG: hypothetical protein M3463_06945 [Verrucomicrobiota bacterium]|nr:hypothetical protein [Verrucomicrobiota bacterium]
MKKFARHLPAAALLALLSSGISHAQTGSNGPAWVQARVQEIAVKAEERRLDEIGWARDIREAKRLAKENGRPVFLFTHDGRLNIGRC